MSENTPIMHLAKFGMWKTLDKLLSFPNKELQKGKKKGGTKRYLRDISPKHYIWTLFGSWPQKVNTLKEKGRKKAYTKITGDIWALTGYVILQWSNFFFCRDDNDMWLYILKNTKSFRDTHENIYKWNKRHSRSASE